MKLRPDDLWPMTLREIWLMYQSHLLETWDHTASLVAALRGIECRIDSIFGGKNKPPTILECHPYRESKRSGMKLTPQNFDVLKEIAFGLMGKR